MIYHILHCKDHDKNKNDKQGEWKKSDNQIFKTTEFPTKSNISSKNDHIPFGRMVVVHVVQCSSYKAVTVVCAIGE